MKQWTRLFSFLLLNILVSACATLAVLVAWDRTHSPMPGGIISFTWQMPKLRQATPTAAPTPPPAPTPTAVFIAYQVKSGDTFESIATRFNITIEELITINGFTKDQPLGEGEVLQIPLKTIPEAGSLPPAGDPGIKIDNVTGIGDIETERVLIKRTGQGELSLVGWKLEDGEGNVFLFPQTPQLTLYTGGAVNIFTKAGANTVVDLYWGQPNPVWKAGKTATLRDPQGVARATYQIP